MYMEPLNVLHINSNYLTSKLHENLIDELENNGINNQIFMPMKKETISNIKYESKHNVYNPIIFKHYHRYFYTWKQAKILNTLFKQIDLSQYNLVHAHTWFTDGNVAYEIFKKTGIPYVVTIRGYTDIFNFYRKRIDLRKRGKKILDHASKIIFVSQAHKNYLFDHYITDTPLRDQLKSKSHVIPNGIGQFWLENEGKPKEINSNRINLLSVGEIKKIKNHQFTIETVNYLNSHSNYDFRLTIIGKTVDQKYYNLLTKKTEDTIRMIEHVTPKELKKYYEISHIFALPSKYETFGLVYPEAMSQGLPVLYTENQGIDKFFEEGKVGYPVKLDDVKDFCEKIHLIIHNYEQMSKNSLANFRKFNWDTISEEFIKVYKQAKGE